MNVKQDLTTAQQMTLPLQNVSTWWEGFDVPVLTTWAIDWTSPPTLAVKILMSAMKAFLGAVRAV